MAPLAKPLAMSWRTNDVLKNPSFTPGKARTRCMASPSEPEVGTADGIVGLHFGGAPAEDDLARLDDVRPVGDGQRQIGVLLDDEHGGAQFLVQLGEAAGQVLDD